MDYNLSENYLFYLVDSIFIHGIVIILRGTLTSEDVHWNIKLGAVHLAFPRDAVSEPTLITVHRWKPTVLSPPLQEHEALVSNMIEISSNSREAFKFEAEVKMSFTHVKMSFTHVKMSFSRPTRLRVGVAQRAWGLGHGKKWPIWKTSKLSLVGGKAFKFVNVKLQIKKLDASLSVLVEHGWICEKICYQEYLHGYSRSARCTLKWSLSYPCL